MVGWNFLLANNKVTLEIDAHQTTHDNQGHVHHTVVAEKPFTLTLSIDGNVQGDIKFEPPANTTLRHYGTQRNFSSLNGSMTAKINLTYQAVAHKEGDITFNPVSVTIDGKNYESKEILVRVIKNEAQATVSSSLKNQKNVSDIFCRAMCDKRKVFTGEPVMVTVSIYIKCQVEQVGLEPYHFDDFLVKELPEKQPRREIINGQPYTVMEKQLLFHPMHEGIKKIKPFNVVYDRLVQDEAVQNFFGMAFFGGVRTQRGSTSSNPLEITVLKIPATHQTVNGVGSFSECSLHVDKQQASPNEPLLMSIRVKGKANFDQVTFDHPELPYFCKFYNSKSSTSYDDVTQLSGAKTFEFIIQVGQAGTIELPAQKFTFFDTHKQQYSTIISKPVTLSIVQQPGSGGQQSFPSQPQLQPIAEQEKDDKQREERLIKDIHFIYEDFGHDWPIKAIPGWFFSVLILMLLLIWTIQAYLPNHFRFLWLLVTQQQNRQKKLEHIGRKIELALIEGDGTHLYQLFIVFICTQFNLAQEDFSEHLLGAVLLEKGWPQAKVAELFDFLNVCASLRFAADKHKLSDNVKKQAAAWLSFLAQ